MACERRGRWGSLLVDVTIPFEKNKGITGFGEIDQYCEHDQLAYLLVIMNC